MRAIFSIATLVRAAVLCSARFHAAYGSGVGGAMDYKSFAHALYPAESPKNFVESKAPAGDAWRARARLAYCGILH